VHRPSASLTWDTGNSGGARALRAEGRLRVRGRGAKRAWPRARHAGASAAVARARAGVHAHVFCRLNGASASAAEDAWRSPCVSAPSCDSRCATALAKRCSPAMSEDRITYLPARGRSARAHAMRQTPERHSARASLARFTCAWLFGIARSAGARDACLQPTPCARMNGGRAGAAAAGCCGGCGPAAARCGRRSRPAPA
jgi:hypothetical protein